jgi:hypothetical protein
MFNIDHSPRRFLTTGRQTRKTDSLLAKTAISRFDRWSMSAMAIFRQLGTGWMPLRWGFDRPGGVVT